jgi:hypothetical protein
MIPNGSSQFLTQSLRRKWIEYFCNIPADSNHKKRPKKSKSTDVPTDKRIDVPADKRIADVVHWWNSIGTLEASKDIEKGLEAYHHEHWRLNNQLPVPQTILGSYRQDDVVLVRLRSMGDSELDVSTDSVLQFELDGGGKSRSDGVLKIRILEIYYGFSDYIQGISTGIVSQRSLSVRNAYAICRLLNNPINK